MGFWGKVLGGLDKAYDAKTDAELAIFRDRRFARADALAASGSRNEAVVTGIRRRTDGDASTITVIRLEWSDPEPRAGALRFGAESPAVVRLGSSVAVRTDGDRVALDHAAMAGTPGEQDSGQRTTRSVPEQGVDDKALDTRVEKAMAKWPSEQGTLVSFERTSWLGMSSLNWDLVVRRADGGLSTVPGDNVPAYSRWFVAPGVTLRIHVDPKDPTKARVDWPELAERMAAVGGRWQDPPPPGSITADMLTDQPAAENVASMVPDQPLDLTPSTSSAEAVEGVTIEQWALVEADLARSRVKPADHDRWVSEHHGIPAGRWSAIKQQWEARQMSDWRVGTAFGAAYDAAKKELKKRPR